MDGDDVNSVVAAAPMTSFYYQTADYVTVCLGRTIPMLGLEWGVSSTLLSSVACWGYSCAGI